MSATVVRYLCGCDGQQVGQSFENGLLVCPKHRQPVAGWDHAPPAARARLSIEVELEGDSQAQLQQWSQQLEGKLLAFPYVRALTISRQELAA